jgi:hypothetical protein
MDTGVDGVCATCSEERAIRQQESAVQRDWEVAQNVPRCNYCRAAEDEDTTLDTEGYCDACRVLPRCSDHSELIAVGHCKSCRQEFCRKCLGFTDVCQSCAAKQKAKPPSKPPGASTAPKAGASSGAKPSGARPKKKRPPGADKAAPKGATKPGEAPPKRKKGEPELDEKGRPKKKPPPRGQAAMVDKLKAKQSGKKKVYILATSVVGALCVLVLLSGMWMKAVSPEEQAKRVEEKMVVVHRAVLHYHKVTGQLPNTTDDIYRALGDMRVKGAKSIKIGLSPAEVPGGVVFKREKGAFYITGADTTGQVLKNANGQAIYLDQYFDSSQAQ